jgi:CobQ-like glutamine amidotransferase family enzyme
MRIEVLFPEIAGLYGDLQNIHYLALCRPDAEVVRTPLHALRDVPGEGRGAAFAADPPPDLVYLGPMTEGNQIKALEALRPHQDRLAELIDAGTHFLLTGNAAEVFGHRIIGKRPSYSAAGLGILDLEAEVDYDNRVNSLVMGRFEGTEVLGFMSQFSRVTTTEQPFITDVKGPADGRGVRRNNLIGTSLMGPILIVNPGLTRWLLGSLDPTAEPTLSFAEEVEAAYAERRKDFLDPKRWAPVH